MVEGGRYKETEGLKRNVWKVSLRCIEEVSKPSKRLVGSQMATE
jgi:hypothetical protein